MSVSRRDFLGAGAAAAAGLAIPKLAGSMPVVTIRERSALPERAFAGRPVIISATNGLTADSSGKKGIQVAYDALLKGADPLDAIVAGVQIVELNPEDQSVGLGGLPNEEGVVQLDASCMHGPSKRAGAVGAIEDIATPAAVAKAVMEHTDHIFLVGAGAKKFALEMGFKEQNLLTEASRADWIRWKSKLNPNDAWLDPSDSEKRPIKPPARARPDDDDTSTIHVYYDSNGVPYTYGTINMNAVTRRVTSRRSRRPADSHGRFRVVSAIRRSSVRDSTAITTSALRDPPDAAKRTSKCAARSSPSSSCVKGCRRSRRSSKSWSA
jgi:N4-(beta-N-acetylglucosaminyl)-L-asparaginase